MYDNYRLTKLIKTDNPSGSNLAERYLVFGDWPASQSNNLVDFAEHYKISVNQTKTSERGTK